MNEVKKMMNWQKQPNSMACIPRMRLHGGYMNPLKQKRLAAD